MSARPADAAFAAAGWVHDDPVLVLTAPLAPSGKPSVAVELLSAPDEGRLACYGLRAGALPPGAQGVLTSGADVVFAMVRPSPAPAPPARGRPRRPHGRLAGRHRVTVAEEHRRQGRATAAMAALTRWAAERGAHSVYLQVTAGNTAARALYRRAGFLEHHRYHYRRRA